MYAEIDVLDPKSQLSISWDPLPCHLQHGSDVTGYILQYSLAGTTEMRSIKLNISADDRLSCRQEPVGPYRCYLTSSLLLEDQLYTFQVAAVNRYGIGPFSDPVNATLHSQSGKLKIKLLILFIRLKLLFLISYP